MKRKISILLTLTMFLLSATSSFATSHSTEISLYENDYKAFDSMAYSNETIYNQLVDIGFTDVEMLGLYQKESNEIGIELKLPEKLIEATGIEYVSPEEVNISYSNNIVSYANTGDVRYRSYDINFDRIARSLGWTGGGTGAAFIIAHVSKNEFAKAIVSSVGLGWVSAIVSVAGVIFSELARYNEGVTITTTSRYAYDEYEGFGKWYLVDADFDFW